MSPFEARCTLPPEVDEKRSIRMALTLRDGVLRALVVAPALALAACSGVPAAEPTASPGEPSAEVAPVRASGELAVYIVRYTDGTSGRQYFLRDAGSKRRLYFATPPEASPGA